MRIGDLDKLKKSLLSKDIIRWTHEYGDVIPLAWIMSTIDNTPELGYEDGIISVETATRRSIELEDAYNNGWSDGFSEGEDERPQGEWKVYARQGGIPISDYCTNCKYEMKWYRNKYNYCPNCGAKMKGGAE